MEKEALLQYISRWKEVDAIELEELRCMDIETRLRRLTGLMQLGESLGITDNNPSCEREIYEVRRKWYLLKGGLMKQVRPYFPVSPVVSKKFNHRGTGSTGI